MGITLLVAIVVALAFAIAGLMGAPYVPILKRDSTALLKLASLTPGQTLIDLGSGDGRLLRAAASEGISCIGYEINPLMVVVSRIICWRYRKLITIHLANIWQIKLPPADVIYVFLMPKFMDRLDRQLESQITRPTRVISYAFQIPKRKIVASTSNTFVYEYGNHK